MARASLKRPLLFQGGTPQQHRCQAWESIDITTTGMLEEKRCLIGAYVQKIKAEPDHQSVQISLYPAIFTREVAGVGFEPTTSGL